MKLTSAHLKEIKKLNPQVAQAINDLKNRHNLRNVTYLSYAAGHTHYLSEGAQLQFFAPTGKTVAADMVSDSTVGCAIESFNYDVGQYTPPLPEGTWIVSCEYYQGYFITVNYVGQLALA